MNKRYERYIDYIVNDLEIPYFINMKDMYGLSEKEYELVLSKIFNQPVKIRNNKVYDNRDNRIYQEYSNGFWKKYEYDDQGKLIYSINSDGFWVRYEYDKQGYITYYEDSDGEIEDNR